MVDNDLTGSRPLGTGRIAEQGLRDLDLKARLGAYKNRIAGSYRLLLRDSLCSVPAGAWVSSKIDGELWFLVLRDQDAWLTNSRGAVIAGDIPLLARISASVPTLKGPQVLAGELHARVEGRRSRVGDLVALLADAEQADVSRLCFAAFDILPDPGQAAPSFGERLVRLKEIVETTTQCWVVDTHEDMGHDGMLALYDELVATGKSEGLIVRSRDGMIYKVKPTHTIDAVILGYTVSAVQEDGVRSLLLGLVHEDGTVQVLGACGNVGSAPERNTLLKLLEPLRVESRYRYASDSGGLYSFIRPQLVAEIKVTDFQGERSDGSAVTSMGLAFDRQAWSPVRPMQSVAILHPTLVRLREDKNADAIDARFAQVADRLASRHEPMLAAELAGSTLLRREVWTKETKGKLAVRKLVVWKTNKEQQNPSFPAYVVHWTDFSPGRASPLDREVRLAMTESSAMQIADKIVADNVKKGWDRA